MSLNELIESHNIKYLKLHALKTTAEAYLKVEPNSQKNKNKKEGTVSFIEELIHEEEEKIIENEIKKIALMNLQKRFDRETRYFTFRENKLLHIFLLFGLCIIGLRQMIIFLNCFSQLSLNTKNLIFSGSFIFFILFFVNPFVWIYEILASYLKNK